MVEPKRLDVTRDVALEHLRHCLEHGSIAEILEDLEGGIRQGLFTVKQIQELAETEGVILLPQVEDYLATRADIVLSTLEIPITNKALASLGSDRFYAVYMSPIDFDDQYYSLFDSIEAYKRHRFAYEYGAVEPIAAYGSRQQAEQVTNLIHEGTLKGQYKIKIPQGLQLKYTGTIGDRITTWLTDMAIGQLSRLKSLHSTPGENDDFLTIDVNLFGNLHTDYSWFYRDFNYNIIDFCRKHQLAEPDPGFFAEFDDAKNDFFELQEWAIQELLQAKRYAELEELRVLLKIGKFAFVHEHKIKF